MCVLYEGGGPYLMAKVDDGSWKLEVGCWVLKAVRSFTICKLLEVGLLFKKPFF